MNSLIELKNMYWGTEAYEFPILVILGILDNIGLRVLAKFYVLTINQTAIRACLGIVPAMKTLS